MYYLLYISVKITEKSLNWTEITILCTPKASKQELTSADLESVETPQRTATAKKICSKTSFVSMSFHLYWTMLVSSNH